MGARPADKDDAAAAAAGGCEGPAVGDYEVVDAGGMAISGPAWTMGGRVAAAGEERAADVPGEGTRVMEAYSSDYIAMHSFQPQDWTCLRHCGG
jgi:hypothetical protein